MVSMIRYYSRGPSTAFVSGANDVPIANMISEVWGGVGPAAGGAAVNE